MIMQAITRIFWEVEGPIWLPCFYRENREKLMKHNDKFVFGGYWMIARDYLFKPVVIPVHPTA